MKIGKENLKIHRPANLDEQLVELTGCSADEIRGQLRTGSPIASSLASALLPFIAGDKPDRHALAETIAAAGVDAVRAKVLALYERGEPDGEKAKG